MEINIETSKEEIGIEFLSTAFDVESADYLNDMMNVYKISSSDLNKSVKKYIPAPTTSAPKTLEVFDDDLNNPIEELETSGINKTIRFLQSTTDENDKEVNVENQIKDQGIEQDAYL
mgnify:CR=1 FL=1